MTKSYQIRIGKQELDSAVKAAVVDIIEKQIRKHGIDKEIEYEINDLVVDFNFPELEARIKQLEDKIASLHLKG
jgi:hypothetical protein